MIFPHHQPVETMEATYSRSETAGRSTTSELRELRTGKDVWHVLEVLTGPAPHLLLWCRAQVRVAWAYPDHWRDLPSEDLFALSTSLEAFLA